MKERNIEIGELQADLSGWLREVRQGTTLLVTDGERRLVRIVPERGQADAKQDLLILPGRGRLSMSRPRARLRGEGNMADIVRENRR